MCDDIIVDPRIGHRNGGVRCGAPVSWVREWDGKGNHRMGWMNDSNEPFREKPLTNLVGKLMVGSGGNAFGGVIS